MTTLFKRKKNIGPDDRAALPGDVANLSDGAVYYEKAGDEEGRPVILIHGFSVPSYIWEPTFRDLTESGFNVLRYDLYGRGYSDRPSVSYDRKLYNRQLLELIEKTGFPQPAALVGLSMGGALAAQFAALHPEKVDKLVLIDPAGFSGWLPDSAKPKSTPVAGDLLFYWNREQKMRAGLNDDLYEPEAHPRYFELFNEQLAFRGLKRALLSTLRNGLLDGMEEFFYEVGRQQRPVMLIWGEDDRVIPFSTSRRVLEAIPHAVFHSISRAGHLPHYERPETVNPVLINFLNT